MIKYTKVDKTKKIENPVPRPNCEQTFQKLKQQFSERVENIFMIVVITSKTTSGKKGRWKENRYMSKY